MLDSVLGPEDEVFADAENDNHDDLLIKSEYPPGYDHSSSPTDDSYTTIDYEDSSAPCFAGVIVCVTAAFIALLLSMVWIGLLAFVLLSVPCFLCLALLSCACPEGAVQVSSTFSTSNKDDDNDTKYRFVHVQRRTWQHTRRGSSQEGRTPMTTKSHPLLSLLPSAKYPTSATVAIEELQDDDDDDDDDEHDPEAGLTRSV